MLPRDLGLFLGRVPFFNGLTPEFRAELAGSMQTVELKNGDTLIRQGADGDSLYVVVDGRLEARMDLPTGGVRRLGAIGRGELVGEEALITGQPRSANVVAVRDSSVLRFDQSGFARVIQQQPKALLGLTQQFIHRAQAGRRPAMHPATIAVVPLAKDLNLRRFTRLFREALAPFHRTALIGRRELTRELRGVLTQPHWPHAPEMLEWLAGLEDEHDVVLYEADAEVTEWTRRCLRQADHVVLVADASQPASLTPLEQELLGSDRPLTQAPLDLVLLHADRHERPQGTLRWLQPRRLRLHHHVAWDVASDHERVARLLTGRATSLVLSGGGARALAQLGIIRVLREAGLSFDFIGGTSMGAMVGSLLAMEWDAERMQRTIGDHVRASPIRDLTFPFVALCSARNGTRALEELTDGWNVEDLWINYFAISADLRRAEEVVHRQGPVWEAIRASASIPGVFPPVSQDGRWLIDGGVLNNFPIDVMARLVESSVVAVDSSQEYAFDFQATYPRAVSGWRLLWQRLNPFQRAPRGPNLIDVLARASEVSALRLSRGVIASTPPALLIRPQVEGFGTLQFEAVDQIIEAGARFATAQLPSWQTQLAALQPPRLPEETVLPATGTLA